MNTLPTTRAVLVNTKSVASFLAASDAQHQLDLLIDQHNKDAKHDRANSFDLKPISKSEDPFLWGQDFEIEPEIWEDFDTKYA